MVFSAYATQFGIDEPTALKLSASFDGGGIARMASTCGAEVAEACQRIFKEKGFKFE